MGNWRNGLGITALAPDKSGVAMKLPTGHYDNDQINVLQAAHKQACKELCIGKTDAVSRERVASMMRLDGYESADVAGLLEDGVGKARERLEEALEAVRAFCRTG